MPLAFIGQQSVNFKSSIISKLSHWVVGREVNLVATVVIVVVMLVVVFVLMVIESVVSVVTILVASGCVPAASRGLLTAADKERCIGLEDHRES